MMRIVVFSSILNLTVIFSRWHALKANGTDAREGGAYEAIASRPLCPILQAAEEEVCLASANIHTLR